MFVVLLVNPSEYSWFVDIKTLLLKKQLHGLSSLDPLDLVCMSRGLDTARSYEKYYSINQILERKSLAKFSYEMP
jgi:hypothetical protein